MGIIFGIIKVIVIWVLVLLICAFVAAFWIAPFVIAHILMLHFEIVSIGYTFWYYIWGILTLLVLIGGVVTALDK